MDPRVDIVFRAGVAYPGNPEEYDRQLERQADQILIDQLRDATWRLEQPTRTAVEAVARYRITALQSACAIALTRMANFAFFDAVADDVRIEVEQQQHQQWQHQQQQQRGVQMPPPLGPEWDPEDDPEMDEEDSEEEPWMVLAEPEVEEVPGVAEEEPEDPEGALGDPEGAWGDGELSSESDIDMSMYPSPIHWTTPSDSE